MSHQGLGEFEQLVLLAIVHLRGDAYGTPIVDKIADENVGKYKVAKVDIDECPGIASKYRIKGVPTVMVFKGGEIKGQHVGVTNKETLIKLLEG